MASDDDLLSLLTAHGQQFLNSFDLPAKTVARKKQPVVVPSSDDEYEEWGGIHYSDEDNFDEELLDSKRIYSCQAGDLLNRYISR